MSLKAVSIKNLAIMEIITVLIFHLLAKKMHII